MPMQKILLKVFGKKKVSVSESIEVFLNCMIPVSNSWMMDVVCSGT
jgi:hypothetical protein